jgi:hypothetical protein
MLEAVRDFNAGLAEPQALYKWRDASSSVFVWEKPAAVETDLRLYWTGIDSEENFSPYYIWHDAWAEYGLDVMSLFIWRENGECRFAIGDRNNSRDDGTG